MRRPVSLLFSLALPTSFLLGCGTGDASGSTSGGTPTGTVSTGATGGTGGAGGAGGAGGEGGTNTEPIDAPDGEWTWVDFPTALCRDGSSTGIGIYPNAASDKVMVYLEGGGACFNGPSCVQNPSSYGAGDFGSGPSGGILDRNEPANPVADWNMVYVPYCTGDVHSGDNRDVMVVGAGGVQQFVGYANMKAYLARVVPTFADASQVLLMGVSAGGFGASATAELVRRNFGTIPVTLLDDSGPPLSDQYLPQCLQASWGDLWNWEDTVYADCPACDPMNDFFIGYANYLTTTYPDVAHALISSTADDTIRLFYGFGENDCAGGTYSEQKFEEGLGDFVTQAADFDMFIIDNSNQHTWLRGDSMYTTQVMGTPLVDWVADVIANTATDVGN